LKLRYICEDEVIEAIIDSREDLLKIYLTAGANPVYKEGNSRVRKAISSSLELTYQRYQVDISTRELDEIAIRIYELLHSGQADAISIPIKGIVNPSDIKIIKK
jgi:hypothetical protein